MGLVRGFDQLELDGDLDLVAHEHPAGFERLVPVQPEILAVDLRARAEADALASPGVLPPAAGLNRERDGPGDVADRQVAGHGKCIRARPGDAGAPETDRGKLL